MPALALRSMPPSPPLVSRRPDALFVGISPFLLSRRVQLAQLAARDAVPAIYQDREHAEVGGPVLAADGFFNSRRANALTIRPMWALSHRSCPANQSMTQR